MWTKKNNKRWKPPASASGTPRISLGSRTRSEPFSTCGERLSQAVRRRRESQNLTQQQLAARMKSSQSRVAKLETGAANVSLDLLFRGLFAAGGDLNDVVGLVATNSGAVGPAKLVRRPTRRAPFPKAPQGSDFLTWALCPLRSLLRSGTNPAAFLLLRQILTTTTVETTLLAKRWSRGHDLPD